MEEIKEELDEDEISSAKDHQNSILLKHLGGSSHSGSQRPSLK